MSDIYRANGFCRNCGKPVWISIPVTETIEHFFRHHKVLCPFCRCAPKGNEWHSAGGWYLDSAECLVEPVALKPEKKEKPDPEDAERDFWRNIDPDTCDVKDWEIDKRLWKFIYGGLRDGRCYKKSGEDYVIDSPAALWRLLEVMLKCGSIWATNIYVEKKNYLVRHKPDDSLGYDDTHAETLWRAAIAHLKAIALK